MWRSMLRPYTSQSDLAAYPPKCTHRAIQHTL